MTRVRRAAYNTYTMITDEDIKKIIEAEREVFTTKDDFDELKHMFLDLQSSVDAYAKKADTYFQEMAAMRRLE